MGTVPAVASFRKLSAAMKCLVQGGAGFIGSNLVDGLIARGDTDEVTGRPMAEAVFAPERPGEVRRSCLDVSRAKRELGWEPQVHLQDGLRTILDGL